ncbi:MAG: 6-phosphogluconolactonase [Desulfovibrio sp.]|jgi:6-phosphogluconolactonase|nr:6-phosphogluconolactonase [Desulfovibrio sp.]
MPHRSVNLALHVMKDPAAMAEKTAQLLLERCERAVAARGVFTLALSGGSTPIPLFRLLATPAWLDRLPWEKIAVYWVDERCVEPDNPQSNYGVARRELLSLAPATRFYRMKGEMDPMEGAAAYEALLREHFDLEDGAWPRFDMVLLGMGEDGHTASLFPDSTGLAEHTRLVIDQYVLATKSDRLTLTLPVLNNARCCVFLVSGGEKHPVLARALDLLAEPTLPAQFVKPANGDLVWIVDEGAAKG